MKKIIFSFLALFMPVFCLSATAANADKVTICHNYGEISVAAQAVPAHLAHGDIVKEEGVPCPERPASSPGEEEEEGAGETMSVVVMMRCEAQGQSFVVVSLSASADLGVAESADCPTTLAALMDQGLDLKSVTGGSANSGDALHLYTDYLLVGAASVPAPAPAP